MVTVEVNLKEGEEEPEQHLDDGEFIERVIVPLDQLYDKLRGMSVAKLCQFLVLGQMMMFFSTLKRRRQDR